MSRILIIAVSFFTAHFACAQEIYQRGEHFGLRYENVDYYAPVFDKIEIHEYFVSGKIGTSYYNLSRNKENSERAYKKFNYKLLNRLLVVGETMEGTIDIMDETGQNYHLVDGPYKKVVTKKEQRFYGNDDLLIVKNKGKSGLYNWVDKKELLPTQYSKIIIHESCEFGGVFIYGRKGLNNEVMNDKGQVLFSFKAAKVSDIYPASICDGYIIQWEHKVGYCKQMSNGKFFLIKPKYDDLYFPNGDARTILVKNRDRLGLFVNYKKFLNCRYEEIELSDNNYFLALVKRRGVTKRLENNGDLSAFRE